MGERRSDGGSHWTDEGQQHLAEVRETWRGAEEGAGPGGTGRGSGTGRRRTGAGWGNSQRSPGTSNVQQQNVTSSCLGAWWRPSNSQSSHEVHLKLCTEQTKNMRPVFNFH